MGLGQVLRRSFGHCIWTEGLRGPALAGRARRIVDHGRLLGCYIGDPQSFTAEQQQLAATYSQPEAVIRETADGQFLRDDADLPNAWAD